MRETVAANHSVSTEQARTIIEDFLTNAMLAAAKGTAEAGKVEMKNEHPTEWGVPVETYGYEQEYNSAVNQSERQLSEYFGTETAKPNVYASDEGKYWNGEQWILGDRPGLA